MDEVTLTVTLTCRPGTIEHPTAVDRLRDDLLDLVTDACLGYVGDTARPLYELTVDEADGPVAVRGSES